MNYRFGLFLGLFISYSFLIAAVEGSNVDPNPAGVGEPPYEMEDRVEERAPLATFEDCTQWVVEATGAEAHLYRTAEQRLYRPYCGKLVYRATAEDTKILVKLKKPVAITEPWDCVNFWNYGAHWLWGEPHWNRALHVSVLVQDAQGTVHDLSFDQSGYPGMAHKYWFLNHAVLLEDIQRPAKFAGFRFQGKKVTDEEPLTIYLGPVYFYQDTLKPLTFAEWPDTLPFPTREETILPANKVADFKNNATKNGEGVKFSYKAKDGKIVYRVRPEAGGLDGITVVFNGKEMQPCNKGGLVITDEKGWDLIDTQWQNNTLIARWSVQSGSTTKEIQFRYRILQKSLIVEMEELGAGPGIVEAVQLGRAKPVRDAKTFRIPFLNFNYGEGPSLLYSDGLFFFTQFDWYYSDASKFHARPARQRRNRVEFNGGAIYTPKTNGERNPLRERLFINVSPDVQEVFPTIPNPPSPMRDVMADRLWKTQGGNHFEGLYQHAKKLRAKGMEKITIRYHEGFWRADGESYTFRTKTADGHGGDAAVKRHVQRIKDLGWNVGLYTNYTDFAPVNAHWNEDWVMRGPQGEWNVSWSRCYAPKPMIAVEQEAINAPQIQAKFGTNHSYCDVHTAVSPFSRVDYDHRVPGAGTFRRTFACFGRLLLNEKVAYKGPVYSEGGNHWWYAGLTDGNYANAHPRVDEQPLFPDFQLLKIHPLEMDAGQVNVATTLAYGHIGIPRDMRTYYMLQPLQEHYSMIPVKRIAYEHDGKLIDTSEALITGAYEQSRLYLEYENGFTVWVNGVEAPWHIKASGQEGTLLQWGYMAMTKDGRTFSYSGLDENDHETFFELCHGPVSHYLNTHGKDVKTKYLAGNGAAALKQEAAGWELIPDGRFKEFGFNPKLIGMKLEQVQVKGVTVEGEPAADPMVEIRDGMVFVKPQGDAFKYRMVE